MAGTEKDGKDLAGPHAGSLAPVHVTRAFLPPRAEYDAWLDKVYESHTLTNNGPIHKELEETLRQRFEVPHLRLMANGTLALQLAIRALGIKGQVITTPFSYVATTSAILWEGCEPVFVDVDPRTCCIDPALIEAAVTPRTTAILATHVYGIPCDVEAIDAIAKRHGLKVIYDAAHAFDVTYKGRSILQWGDASTLSFHATKLFHTVEGGAVVVHDSDRDNEVRLLRSFGHVGDEHFSLGMNAKMSEVHAAMGMAVLPHIERIKQERSRICQRYEDGIPRDWLLERLTQIPGYNFAYFPIVLRSGAERERLASALAAQGIHVRRYFHPSLDMLPYVQGQSCPMSRDFSNRVICLPLYVGLPDETVDTILRIMSESAVRP